MSNRVVPAGSPFWVRTNTLAHYGGHVSKAEYSGIPALGGDTDLAAVDFNRLPTDLAAVARTNPVSILTYTAQESTSDDPLVSYVALPTGVFAGEPYEGALPPVGFPTAELSGTTDALITFASSFTDSYSVEADWAPSIVRATVNALTAGYQARIVSISGSELAVTVTDSSGSTVQDQTVTLEVW